MSNSPIYKNKLLAFTGSIGDLAHHKIEIIDENYSIIDASKVFSNPLIAYLVVEKEGVAIGLIARQHLLDRKTDNFYDKTISVEEVMHKQPISVQQEAPVFDTLLYMMQHDIQEILVLEKNKPVSVVTQEDWTTIQINYPTLLINNIDNATSINQLVRLRKESKSIIWENFEKEENAVSLTKIITVVNDAIGVRIIQLSLEEMQRLGKGVPPVPFVWIGMGSEGRKAQTIRTDQDNGIIFEDVVKESYYSVQSWFLELAELVVHGLDKCGFPLCEGNIMATNAVLCNSLEEWKYQFNRIIRKGDVKELLEASIFFDFRCIYGDDRLVKNLWNHLFFCIENRPLFMRFFAENILQASRPPIKNWQWHTPAFLNIPIPSFDIKREGTAPLDAAIRLLALKYQISETNTLERLQLILENGGISKAMADNVHVAFDFVLRLRFKLEFSTVTKVETHNHIINPTDLHQLDVQKLKDALTTIYQLQDYVYQQITNQKVPWAFK